MLLANGNNPKGAAAALKPVLAGFAGLGADASQMDIDKKLFKDYKESAATAHTFNFYVNTDQQPTGNQTATDQPAWHVTTFYYFIL